MRDLVRYVCEVCGIEWAVPKRYADSKRRAGISCPNGHNYGEPVADKLDTEIHMRIRAQNNEEAADLTISALRGQITRLKKQLAAQGGKP